jgi:uncharacterized protein YdgA (DUF945 family)
MRKIISILALLAILAAGSPLAMGYLTKRSYIRAIESIPANSPFELKLIDYKLGYLRSTAELELHLKDPQLKRNLQKDLSSEWILKEKEEIMHGPYIRYEDESGQQQIAFGRGVIKTKMSFPPEAEEKLQQILGTIPKLHAVTFIDFSGDYEFTFMSDAISFKSAEDNVDVTWGGFEIEGDISSDFNDMETNATLKSLAAHFPEGNFSMGEVTMQNDMQRENKYKIWTGDGSLSLPSFSFNAAGKKVMLDEFSIASSQALQDTLASVALKMGLKRLVVDKEVYGPAVFEFSITNLDAQSWADVQEKIQQLNGQSELSPQQQQAQVMLLMPKIFSLLNAGAEFTLHAFELKTPEGDIEMEGKITLAQSEQQDTNPISGFQTMLQTAKANLDAEFPMALLTKIVASQELADIKRRAKNPRYSEEEYPTEPVQQEQLAQEQAQQKINQLLESGMLIKDKDEYTFSAIYDRGKLTINGKPIPTPFAQ